MARLMDRNKVILIVTNLDEQARAQMEASSSGA